MGPLVDVPALVRIEDEKWVFERVDEQTLHQLTHRLVLHEEEGTRTIGATVNLASAMHVAKRMAEQEQKIVLISSDVNLQNRFMMAWITPSLTK